MTKFVPLNLIDHAEKTWVRTEDYRFAARQAAIPVVISELSQVANSFPIAFIRDEDSFKLVALLSYKSDENLFVGPDGKWLADYIPMALRSDPFRLLRRRNQPGMVLCVDQDNGCIGQNSNGEKLFDADGSPAPIIKDVLQFLERFEFLRKLTDEAVVALVNAKVVVPWSISVVDADKSEKSVKGIYRVDETMLNQLDDDMFIGLRKARALPIVYMQLFSMQQTRKLGHLAQTQVRLKSQAAEHQRILNEMFKLDDGTIPL